jgi:alkanesulfonate monooxygenase SsuD/methylene tetrahydromethanopterin reductase-like flavin-dependent oxidoreductase (luciferase family)
MDISIGLPATIPGVARDQFIAWAQRADEGPFHSLGVIDRLVFPNYEPMIALAAAAAVTRRIRLTTTVLLAPLRNTAVLAKEAATIDVISNGRLTLGLGVGSREDDFQYTGLTFHDRGKRFDRQLDELHQIWTGGSVNGVGPVGPMPVQPGGPPILIGGFSPRAIQRLARWGIGYISGGAPAQQAQGMYRQAEDVWRSAGRPGEARLVGSSYYALDADAQERGGRYLRTYYGEGMGGAIASAMPASPAAIRETITSFATAGADEIFLWPTTPDVDQVEQLARIVS